ncbi:MAG TPA: bifunctional rhamnulose-1-phosphate aldolase/short-chain dehydrogenase [Vicinamibacterales bacterium]|nr:bifunctional rhamnulose-1-phosphate aldolase/short-chain dehydrogenase [Vicinamibacterales bacterium]
MRDATTIQTKFLEDLWNPTDAARLASDPLSLLRYRSNLLGADLRITNFGGGNTSSKFPTSDPLTGESVRVMAVKGSGGDLRSIANSGFALLYLEKLEQLVGRYRGEAHEDEMVAFYPLCAFGENRVAASIDTPLHAFLPFDHVDHLHPDWAIALAASANGREKLDEFNRRYGRHIAWVPWQRPGFELALMLRRAVREHPGCDGIVLASHGLFTWGDTARDCYASSIKTIDQMGEFIDDHSRSRSGPRFGGAAVTARIDRSSLAAAILPSLRGRLSAARRVVGHFEQSDEALEFANSAWADELCQLGTSCPDHFLRTRISPMFVPWDPARDSEKVLHGRITERLSAYHDAYVEYYQAHAQPDSPPIRGSTPSVVVIPALGVFGFGKDKREARITTEFFVNAVHVMAGSAALAPTVKNYVALARSEAFRIEYWALEEAKLQRMPPEREFSRKIVVVVGAGSGIGREVALEIARRGGHVVLADANAEAVEATRADIGVLKPPVPSEMTLAIRLDLSSRESIAAALRATVLQFGGIDVIVNTAATYPTPEPGAVAPDEVWERTMRINVTSNYLLAEEARRVLAAQRLSASIVLTSSANAVVPKSGSEPYDVSKAAINHLIRELAVSLGPLVRVNGVAPATVVAGSAMFPRDRVVSSLKKYEMTFQETESTEALRAKLADFYAQRTITRRPILPEDCARAICWLAGDLSAKTTGHVIPVDGGLPEAFLR